MDGGSPERWAMEEEEEEAVVVTVTVVLALPLDDDAAAAVPAAAFLMLLLLLLLALPATPKALETAKSEPAIRPFLRSEDDELEPVLARFSPLSVWRRRRRAPSDKADEDSDKDEDPASSDDDQVDDGDEATSRVAPKKKLLLLLLWLLLTRHAPRLALHFMPRWCFRGASAGVEPGVKQLRHMPWTSAQASNWPIWSCSVLRKRCQRWPRPLDWCWCWCWCWCKCRCWLL